MALAIGTAIPVANAQPPADPQAQYEQLSEEAAKADEDLLKAQDDLERRNAELDQANADLAAATASQQQAAAAVEQARVEVDRVAAEAFQGGATSSRMSAVMSSGSVQNFLDRMSALGVLAEQQNGALNALNAALAQADLVRADMQGAQERAAAARDAAAKLTEDIRQHKTTLNARVAQVRQALQRLSPATRQAMGTVKDTGSYLGPPGAANTALQAALAKRGSEYEWGADGPSEFDCSGLTMWAYRAAGISLPHSSRSQYTLGRPVAQSELQPGDLVFYDDGTGNPAAIHHVGMYVGDGKMVDAPTEGQLVDVRSVRGDGHYIGARRIVG
ncbi:C40 family peptidase [Amycolatopsis thermophila]|uniref:Cell wall-associated NlpC family hydrolase n=1 Tax=Amycolatopsis thermophila TaxID=206084 RepID=A0ABU0F3D5_9PSEU|nr:NlpC/P60 family protein [Amycolatopsis thermophila]MDQ0382003.1 cell wall-associated NlpC family hydrolase [Amycolatopsis thermophila]